MAWLAFGSYPSGDAMPPMAAYLLAHLALAWLWKSVPDRIGLAWLLPGALAARGLLLPSAPSDDVFRYLWEGRVQNHGFDPYLLAPDSPVLAPLRTAYWPLINHPDWPSIYFPFTQLCFRLVAAVGESVLGIKLLACLFDLGTLACLLGALREMGLPRRHVLLYALNPLVLLYTAGEGHLESVFLFWIAAGAYARLRGRSGLALLALGFACMSNAKGLVLLPFILHRANFRFLPLLLIPCLLWLPFAASVREALAVPLRFAGHFHFNGLVYNLVSPILPPSAAPGFCLVILLLALAAIFLVEPDPLRSMFQAYFAFLLCAPTVHPWYILPLAAGQVLRPAPHWGAWTASVAFLFPVYSRFESTGLWRESGLSWLLEYGSWLAVWAFFLRTRPGALWPRLFPPPRRLSVILPVLDERENIVPCLRSILLQEGPRPGIMVVDGGSRDGTPEAASGIEGVRVISSPPGRGVQIAAGMAASDGDLILVMHADSRLAPGSLTRLYAQCAARPDAPGGAFGLAYDDARFRFRMVAWANNLRARFCGIAFGDQAQFFRREALEEGFPPYRLMEDVELSLRLKQHGSLLYIPQGVRCSARRWARKGFLRNVCLVIGLTTQFLARRRLGLEAGSGDRYYARYYGSPRGLVRSRSPSP